jgi:hypothetical protein
MVCGSAGIAGVAGIAGTAGADGIDGTAGTWAMANPDKVVSVRLKTRFFVFIILLILVVDEY